MIRRLTPVFLAALALSACGGGEAVDPAPATPERAVVAWFEALDTDDATTASDAVTGESLAVMLGVENGLDAQAIAALIDDGVPSDLASDYWSSFAEGFAEFAARPISTLTVGESTEFEAEGQTFAAVPIASAPGSESVVLVREVDGGWRIDLVATLADGFSSILADRYASLGSDEASNALRSTYDDTVVPALWAAMAEGGFGDDFNRVALTLLAEIEG